jgi:hypothetical protein
MIAPTKRFGRGIFEPNGYPTLPMTSDLPNPPPALGRLPLGASGELPSPTHLFMPQDLMSSDAMDAVTVTQVVVLVVYASQLCGCETRFAP